MLDRLIAAIRAYEAKFAISFGVRPAPATTGSPKYSKPQCVTASPCRPTSTRTPTCRPEPSPDRDHARGRKQDPAQGLSALQGRRRPSGADRGPDRMARHCGPPCAAAVATSSAYAGWTAPKRGVRWHLVRVIPAGLPASGASEMAIVANAPTLPGFSSSPRRASMGKGPWSLPAPRQPEHGAARFAKRSGSFARAEIS